MLREAEAQKTADGTGTDPGRRLMANSYKEFESWCREHGHRVTARRRTVATIILAAQDYPRIDELCSRVKAANPRICLSTLYRTLRLLAEFGLVGRYTFRGAPLGTVQLCPGTKII